MTVSVHWKWDRLVTYGLALVFYTKFNLSLYMGKKKKIISFIKTIAAYDLKVGRGIELNDLMNLHEYQRSRSFFDLCQRLLGFQT